MKKTTLLLIFALTTLFACKKDDAERNSERLIGRWKVESVTYVAYENGVEKERNQYSDLPLIWDFRDNGTATVNFDSEDQQVSWNATANVLQIGLREDTKVDFQINTLSKDYMHVVFEDDVDVIDGITYKQTIEFKLRKQ